MKTSIDLDHKYMKMLKDISFNPIFIMGLHRSGTSILYKMLGETSQFNIVTGYHILKYDELLNNYINKQEEKVIQDLTDLFKTKGITNRKIDNLPITPDFAQEYVYLLTEKNYQNKLTPKNLYLFENLCKKIQFISDKNKPILLKNPYDFPNFLFIKKVFPNAKFVFIHRNPIKVIDSTMRAWKTLLKNKNPYTALFSSSYDQLFENLLALYISRMYYSSVFPIGIFSVINRSTRAVKYYLKNIDQLQGTDYISIRYEDLCREPDKVIPNVMDLLHLSSDMDFSQYISPRKMDLLPEVKMLQKFISLKMKQYFEYFKYDI
jgi:hypothetical protein